MKKIAITNKKEMSLLNILSGLSKLKIDPFYFASTTVKCV